MNNGSTTPVRVNRYRVSGQSIVEAVVVLALVAILVIALLRGVGQQTASRLQFANEALEQPMAGSASGGAGAGSAPGGAGAGGSAPGAAGDQDSGAGRSGSSGGGALPGGSAGGGGHVEPVP